MSEYCVCVFVCLCICASVYVCFVYCMRVCVLIECKFKTLRTSGIICTYMYMYIFVPTLI